MSDFRQHCEYCERETAWNKGTNVHDWCDECGAHKGQYDPENNPGGCPEHPDATHENGYGLAGGGFGVYSVCNECGTIFDKFEDMT